MSEEVIVKSQPVPVHQWTHTGGRVLLVKCVESGGKSYGGFQWPKSGFVKPLKCSMTPDCDSGGLFGWAWGVSIGDGKEPDYRGDWIVFAAKPEQVIALDGKQKVAAATPDEVECEVVYYGYALGAMMFTHQGRMAFVEQNSRGSASNSGYSGSASNSGDYGSASNSGSRGSASNSGYSGSASNSGYSGSASNSGDYGSASATGKLSIAANTGECSTVEVGPEALGAVTSRRWYWKVRLGAVVAVRWEDDSKVLHHLMLTSECCECSDGDVVKVCDGKVVKEWPS